MIDTDPRVVQYLFSEYKKTKTAIGLERVQAALRRYIQGQACLPSLFRPLSQYDRAWLANIALGVSKDNIAAFRWLRSQSYRTVA